MTRKEYFKERNIPTDSLEANSINEGIDWAIEKVVKYLQSKLEYSPDIDGLQIYDISMEEFINDVRKAMEK